VRGINSANARAMRVEWALAYTCKVASAVVWISGWGFQPHWG